MFIEIGLAKFFAKCYDQQYATYKYKYIKMRISHLFYYLYAVVYFIRFSLSLFCLKTQLCDVSIAGDFCALLISSLTGNSVELTHSVPALNHQHLKSLNFKTLT